MSLLKAPLMLVIFIINAGFYCLASNGPKPSPKPLIGYGSSDAIVGGKSQEFKRLGFKLAFNTVSRRGTYEQLVLEELIDDKRHLGCLVSAKKLVDRGAVILTGYSSSHESALVADYAQSSNIIFLTGMSAPSLGGVGEYVHSVGLSQPEAAAKLTALIRKKYPGQKGLALWKSKALFSQNLTDALKTQSLANSLDFIDIDQGANDLLDSSILERIRSKKYRYILFTTYAGDSKRILEQLKENQIDTPIFGNQTWPTRDIELLHSYFSGRKQPVYFLANWLSGSPEAKRFEVDTKKAFGASFAYDIALGYDYGVAIASVINNIEGDITPANFIAAVKKQPCFDNTTCGRICLAKEGGFAQRKSYIVRYENGELKEEK